ncbi:hypothetical protein M406DRAFT_263195 [Cryphonectria parasitica EP155]|uniref:C2H2-type domain-containing protein n=1 Tax=Cryphonectria parasitica (strain ATCC 38755 / EP155) TaxID=660469 RepID=A0A9P5CLS1_CRYP1|nr:uncharacterized protein M406DRAFT_263195 [Cryphonectria parasitica EP155]KAF3762512.1 hypothetical protein M406DRAFT_263195 [Cryphonectria parasitica EP155]
MSSSEAGDEYEHPTQDITIDDVEQPPPKRLKLGDVGSATPSAVVAEADPEPEAEPEAKAGLDEDDNISISSDSSGDIPSSPANARLEDEDFQPQVTVCAWEDCGAGDLRTMDKLVKHIHDEHIEGRQKKYTCQWVGCSRQGANHASGYALKAHMRSHTREKPFFCYLPECDKCFTRSDALAKHMRTVHETEALRPSDPVPKSMQVTGVAPAAKSTTKLKIIIRTPQSHAAGHDDTVEDGVSGDDTPSDLYTQLTEKDGFAARELKMPLNELHRVCKHQVKWAEEDGEKLKLECKKWEELYRQAWLEKEVLLSQMIKSEVGWQERRRAILSGATDIIVNGGSPEAEPTAAPVTNGERSAEE